MNRSTDHVDIRSLPSTIINRSVSAPDFVEGLSVSHEGAAVLNPEAGFDSTRPKVVETIDIVDNPVGIYLLEIGSVRLLPREEERILARRVEVRKYLRALESNPIALDKQKREFLFIRLQCA